jgi:mannosylglycerate hydrolase
MKPVYHIVSHSHWDREWYKSFEQFRSMLVNMVDDLLELLRKDPRYACFTLDGQTVVLDDYLAVRPEHEEELRRLVREGRLMIGPWYVLPDEFLVSAEATVRNLLAGARRARDFGAEMKVGYIPDSFGHIAMMPAILNGFGIDTVMLYRGFGGEPGQDSSEYWWTGPDGTRCLMLHLYRNGYSACYFHQETDEQILERFRGLKEEVDARAATSHRLLMNGGDHHWPDPKLPQTLDLLRKNFEGEFIHSTVPRYAAAVKSEVHTLPEISGELRFGYRYAFVVLGGVYSSRMYLKQENWQKQMLMQRYVEPLNAYAVAEGMRSQLPLVRHAWRTLMQNHPHDSICGCSIDPVHREMMTRFKAVEDTGKSVVEMALNQIIPYDDLAAGDDRHVFFFNPSPFVRSGVAEAHLSFYLQDIVVGLNPDVKVAPRKPPVAGFTLHDAQGNEVPYQIVGRREGYDISYTNYNYPKQTYADNFNVLVDVRNVQPMGFKGLSVKREAKFPKYATSLRCGRNFIENDVLRVEANTRGEVTLKDKTSGRAYSRLNVFEDSGDVGDEYNYSYPRRDKWIYSNRGTARLTLLERGPLRVALRITNVMNVPMEASPDKHSRGAKRVRLRIDSVLSLTQGSRFLDVQTTIENNAKDHRLRVLFTTGVKTDTCFADSQFCIVERRQQEYDVSRFSIEHPAKVAPMQRFVTVKDKERAFTLFSYGLPEYELKLDRKGTLALTLLRCVGTLAADKPITRPGGKAGWHNDTPDAQCQGRHTVRYGILLHSSAGIQGEEERNEASEQFHLPFISVRRKTAGALPTEGSFMSVTPNFLVLSALKESEDGKALIARISNPGTINATGALQCAKRVARAALCRLDETETAPADVVDGKTIPVHLPPAGIVTLRISLEE